MPIVRVSWFEGKNYKQKAKVAAEITDSIARNTGTDPKYVLRAFRRCEAERLGWRRQVLRKCAKTSAKNKEEMTVDASCGSA